MRKNRCGVMRAVGCVEPRHQIIAVMALEGEFLGGHVDLLAR
jgi:hypothetical protein